MLASRSRTDLCFNNADATLLVGAAVPAFCSALRASRLDLLVLRSVRLWESLEDGLAVIDACTGHPTMRKLSLRDNSPDGPAPAAVGVALAALVTSGPLLEELYVSDCGLGDAAMRLLFAAVAGSTRLRKLVCFGNEVSTACAKEAILPAVQANASLRELDIGETDFPELLQAVEMVRAREG